MSRPEAGGENFQPSCGLIWNLCYDKGKGGWVENFGPKCQWVILLQEGLFRVSLFLVSKGGLWSVLINKRFLFVVVVVEA